MNNQSVSISGGNLLSTQIRKQLLGRLGLLLGLFCLLTVFAIMSPAFLSIGNLRNILIQSGTNAIISAGMTFVIIVGEIDLSVGAILALCSVVGAQTMVSTGSIFIGVVVTLLLGIVLGFINGAFIAYLGFPSFIVTLSTMWLFRGSAYVYTEGQAIVNLPHGIMKLATGNFLGLPNIVWLIAVIYLICYVVLTKLTIGRKFFATGDNQEAARLSGINVKKTKMIVFTISGFLAALAGIVLMSRLNSGQPVAGMTFELSAIAAAVIGGTSLTKGGVGGVVGTLIGAIFIATLQNGLVILNVSSFWQQVCMGIVVLIAVAIDKYRKAFSK
jgi:ribose transport system permease protein